MAAEVTLVIDLKTLHAEIGELALENDFLSDALGKTGLEHGSPLRQQAKLPQLSRSTLCYEPRPLPAADLAIMRRMGIRALRTVESGVGGGHHVNTSQSGDAANKGGQAP